MKCLKKVISAKDASGFISLRPDVPEDLWHAYNLLQEGDLVKCTTIRKVVKESSTGSTTSSKMRMNLTIEANKVDFDPDTFQELSGKAVGKLWLAGPSIAAGYFGNPEITKQQFHAKISNCEHTILKT